MIVTACSTMAIRLFRQHETRGLGTVPVPGSCRRGSLLSKRVGRGTMSTQKIERILPNPKSGAKHHGTNGTHYR